MTRIRMLILSVLAVLAVSAVASASASAFTFEYEVCQKGGTEKFKDHLCTPGTKETTGEWSWLPITGGEGGTGHFTVESDGSTFELTNGVKKSVCTAVTNTGLIIKPISDEGKIISSDEVNLKFTGCTNGGTCEAFAPAANDGTGIIEVTDLDGRLTERKTSGGVAVLADEFFKSDAGNEFVTIDFEVKATDAECTGYPPTKVKGQVAGQCINLTAAGEAGEVELNFPNPELKGNTLEAFGGAAKLFGSAEVFLSDDNAKGEEGPEGWSVRCV